MKKQHLSECAIFKPRLVTAVALCCVGVSLALISVRGVTNSASSLEAVKAPGFHPPVTMPSSNGGTEPSLAIRYDGVRYVSWQAPGEFAKSADGVNFSQITTPDTGAAGDVTNAMGA